MVDVNAELLLYLVLVVAIVLILANHYLKRDRESDKAEADQSSSVGSTQVTSSVSESLSAPERPVSQIKPTTGEPRSSPSPSQQTSIAATAALSAATPKSSTCYHGVVKRYSQRNGIGFITCEATHARHGVDVRVFRDEYEAASLEVGDAISFYTVLGGRPGCPRSQPWATSIRKEEAASQAASAVTDSGAHRRIGAELDTSETGDYD